MQPLRGQNRSLLLNENVKGVSRSYEVSSVRKALDILGVFSIFEPEWPLSALARRLGLPKSTAHNLLRTLQSVDLVQQNREGGAYRLGPRALEMGLTFSQSSEVLAHARPALRSLAQQTNETVKLGIMSNDQVLIVAAVESTHQLHTRGDIGTRWPLHSTSLGKAILSALSQVECEKIVRSRGMPQFTLQTLSSWPQLSRELDIVRSRGYATDFEENERGVRCVAAPIVDGLRGSVAAISLSGPRLRLEDDRLGELATQVLAAAKSISKYSRLERA
jgi:IclR family transcriptional regulator, KDG regulon repressor